MTKSVVPPFLDRDDDQTMTSDNNRPLNSKNKQKVYSVSGCCLKIKKKPFGLRTWKGQLKPRVLLELPLLVSDVRNLKEIDLSSPTGAKREPYQSFDKVAIQHNTILQLYTVRKQLPTLNTLNSTLVGDLLFPGSVETHRKRLGRLVYCWI